MGTKMLSINLDVDHPPLPVLPHLTPPLPTHTHTLLFPCVLLPWLSGTAGSEMRSESRLRELDGGEGEEGGGEGEVRVDALTKHQTSTETVAVKTTTCCLSP